jgi:hypothetical protein
MPIVAELPPITQEYKNYAHPDVEISSDMTSSHKLKMRSNEYLEFFDLNQQLFKTYLKKIQVIEKKANDLTFFGSLDVKNEDNTLTSSEVNSISLLIGSYKREVNRLKNKNQKVIEISEHIFYSVNRKLYKLPFEKCAVEINSDESMKFTLSFSNDRILMITKSNNFEILGISRDQVVYSFFINRKLISSDVTNLETFTKNFKGYISI